MMDAMVFVASAKGPRRVASSFSASVSPHATRSTVARMAVVVVAASAVSGCSVWKVSATRRTVRPTVRVGTVARMGVAGAAEAVTRDGTVKLACARKMSASLNVVAWSAAMMAARATAGSALTMRNALTVRASVCPIAKVPPVAMTAVAVVVESAVGTRVASLANV